MDEIEIETVATPDLDDPVFVEGLPGVGLVGKLAVDHLLSELDNQAIQHIYSEHFPPAVSVASDGTAELPHLTLHAVESEARDLIVLAGDVQAQEPVGQYRVAQSILDTIEDLGVHEVITLGGFGTGDEVEEYDVIGAVTAEEDDLFDTLKEAGVSFDPDDGPGNIVGMSGLLLGLSGRRGRAAAALLGKTSGYHVDPASARAVLEILQTAFGFEISLETLNEQAEQVQELLEQIQQAQQQEPTTPSSSEDLRYFG